jgi:hypothetical protein
MEAPRELDGAVAHEDKRRAGALDVPAPAAQLRGCFLAVGSTEMADVCDQELSVRCQVAELDIPAFRVEHG